MKPVSISIVIDQPIDTVFRAFADIPFVTEVDPNTISAKLVKGQAFHNGAKYDMVFKGLTREIKGWYEFVEYDEPSRFKVDLLVNLGPGNEVTTFEESSGGVKVTWVGSYDLKWYAVALTPLLRWMTRKKGNNWLRLMKQAIEAGYPPKSS